MSIFTFALLSCVALFAEFTRSAEKRMQEKMNEAVKALEADVQVAPAKPGALKLLRDDGGFD